MMNELTVGQIAANVAILAALIIFIPILFPIVLSFTKIKLSRNWTVYLYAFSSGLLLIISIFGLISEGFETIEENLENLQPKLNYNEQQQNAVLGSVVAFGALAGLGLALGLKIIVYKLKSKRLKKMQLQPVGDSMASHDGCIINIEEEVRIAGKKIAVVVIASHKFIDGLSSGLIAADAGGIGQFTNWGIILGLVIHEIPAVIIMFYIQVQARTPKHKALLYIFSYNVIVVPFLILGITLGNILNNSTATYWITPFLRAFGGGALLFTALLEIIPETVDKHKLCTKHWFITAGILIFSIIFTLLLIRLADDHGHGSQEGENHSEAIAEHMHRLINQFHI